MYRHLFQFSVSYVQGYSTLSERMGLYMPSAIFALCVGCVAFNECFKETSLIYSSFDVTESLDNSHKVQPITLPQSDI